MTGTQRVKLANGATRVYRNVAQFRYTNSPPHHHWHLMRFDSFELHTLDGRTLVRDRKSGFCLADHWGAAPGSYPGRHPVFLGDCDQFHPEATHVPMGTSPGYTDRYPAFFHGQNIDITGVPAGIYDLMHRVNATMQPARAPLRQQRGVGAHPADVARRHAVGARPAHLPGDRYLLMLRRAPQAGPARARRRARRTNAAPAAMTSACAAMPNATASSVRTPDGDEDRGAGAGLHRRTGRRDGQHGRRGGGADECEREREVRCRARALRAGRRSPASAAPTRSRPRATPTPPRAAASRCRGPSRRPGSG